MARFFLSREAMNLEAGTIPITGDDAHHIAFSLRMAVGDALTVCDMQKTEYRCIIESIRPELVVLKITETVENHTELPIAVHLYQSLPKGDKMDTIVQKAVELGAASVTPVASARCIMKLDAKSAEKKVARWQRIVYEASKQCGRAKVPTVENPMFFADALNEATEADIALFCYEGNGTVPISSITEEIKSPDTVSIMIGPEGGYSEDEAALAKESGMKMTGLGHRILRTETAAPFVLSCLSYKYEL